MSQDIGFETYRTRMGEVPGAFRDPDTFVFQAISDAQVESGIVGDFLEIGSYQGQSAIALGFLLQDGETLHVCEPFPEPSPDNPDFLPHTIDWYDTYNQRILEEHYLRFHYQLPEIHAHSSLDLAGKLAPNSFRFVHLDGGHAPEVLRSDITLTQNILTEQGIVAHNLYRSLDTLEAAVAAWTAVANSEVFPFCATETRLYSSVTPYTSEQTADLHARLRSIPQTNLVSSRFLGVDVALLQPAPETTTLRSLIPPILLPPARRARSWIRSIKDGS